MRGLILVLLLAALLGCTSLPVRLGDAYIEITRLRGATERMIIDGKMDSADAMRVEAQLNDARAKVDEANLSIDHEKSKTLVHAAQSELSDVKAYLQGRQGEPL